MKSSKLAREWLHPKREHLIVFERNITLQRYIDVGTLLNCRVSREIIETIFQTATPLHDGAIIIRGTKLAAAGCFLPLSRREDLDPKYGTRHRAAVGLSHETDALVLIVSEEGGSISVAKGGEIYPRRSPETLRKTIAKYILEEEGQKVTF